MSKSIFSTSNKWAEFERRKKALQAAGLSNAEYERRVTDLARKLKV